MPAPWLQNLDILSTIWKGSQKFTTFYNQKFASKKDNLVGQKSLETKKLDSSKGWGDQSAENTNNWRDKKIFNKLMGDKNITHLFFWLNLSKFTDFWSGAWVWQLKLQSRATFLPKQGRHKDSNVHHDAERLCVWCPSCTGPLCLRWVWLTCWGSTSTPWATPGWAFTGAATRRKSFRICSASLLFTISRLWKECSILPLWSWPETMMIGLVAFLLVLKIDEISL